MRLSLCLLSAAYLSTGVNAFIPYSFKVKTIPRRSSISFGDAPERRFVPVKLLSGDIGHDEVEDSSSSDDSPLTLDIKNSNVRRDNIYKVVLADKPSSPNTVALNQDGMDYSYFSTVNVGTPGQPVWMMLDTGGANTWLFGSDCTAQPCKMHNTFGEESSSTVEPTNETFEVGYGAGKVSGDLVKDHLTIADINVEMTFGLANNATDDFRDYPIDGILGLGRSDETSMGDRPAFMDLVTKQENLESNIVSFHMSRNSDGEKDGSVTFGGVDKSKFKGDIVFTDVAESSIHWNIPLEDVSIDGKSWGLSNKTAIIDTGTSYSLIPPEDAEALHKLIPGSKKLSDENYLVPCDSTVDIQFHFSGVGYSMSPKDYVGSELESGDGCVSTLIAEAMFGDDIMILGDTFLKNVYSVFDYDNDRIGFAQLPDSSTPGTNTSTVSAATPSDTFSSTSTDSSSPTSTSEFTGAGTPAFRIPSYGWPVLATFLFLSYI